MTHFNNPFEDILVQLGDFGKHQRINFTLIMIAIMLYSAFHISFVFTARDINYRCAIPECENISNTRYYTNWLSDAIPNDGAKLSKCFKFFLLNTFDNECTFMDFDHQYVEDCDEFIHETKDHTIVQDFNLHCEDNTWKLTLVGTMNNFGQFIGVPIAGIISDRYGRRTVLVLSMVICSVAGLARAFSQSYVVFIILEFIDSAIGSGTFPCGFILGVELVGPAKRVLTGNLIALAHALGQIVLALLAWWLQHWRHLILVLYAPSFLIISYFWLTPESVRWLLIKGRVIEAQNILRKAAKTNNKFISEKTLNLLKEDSDRGILKYSITDVFKSKPLLYRFINCSYCWLSCTFLYYGLTLNSVSLSGNPYLSFILASLAEIPAYIVTYYTVDRWGRRKSQCTWFVFAGVCCLISIFTTPEIYWLQLTVFFLGKFGATSAFTIIYVITIELFPTPLRQLMMGSCSMIGRLGSMTAPQIPLLERIWSPLPLIMFGFLSIVAGILSLMFPETMNSVLPNTIEEAENIGSK